MVVDSYKPYWGMLRAILLHLIPISIYVLLICALDLQFHLEDFQFPVAMVAFLGTVIGLLIAFRTNSCYDRWWEARTLWGAIVNDSRSWVRQLLSFTGANTTEADGPSVQSIDPQVRRMALRQSAWCFALSRSLRGQEPTRDIAGLIDASELPQLENVLNVPNQILLDQARDIRQLYQSEQIELFQLIELEKTLVRLTNSMGGCERIRNTVFPTTYSRVVHFLVYVFVFFLPFGLVKVPPVGLVFTSILLSFSFLLIDRVSTYLQDPFNNLPSDTPMLALSRTIEINIKQMLGEKEIPEPICPKNGILM